MSEQDVDTNEKNRCPACGERVNGKIPGVREAWTELYDLRNRTKILVDGLMKIRDYDQDTNCGEYGFELIQIADEILKKYKA